MPSSTSALPCMNVGMSVSKDPHDEHCLAKKKKKKRRT